MVTGVEAAGLALAIFPILVQSIGFYLEGSRTIKDWWNYKGVLSRLVRQLEMEQVKFENTCGIFLEGLVTAEQATILVGGTGWDDIDFQEVLRQRLQSNVAKAFVDAVVALHLQLRKLSIDIGAMDNCMLPPVSLDRKTQKKLWKSLKLVLQKSDHESLLHDVKQINDDLYKLTMQRTPTIVVQKPTLDLVKHYNRIQNYAKSLHDVFQERFTSAVCQCTMPHTASLRLHAVPTTDLTDETDQRMNVYFEFESSEIAGDIAPWCWRALEFEPIQRDMDTDQGPFQAEETKDVGLGSIPANDSSNKRYTVKILADAGLRSHLAIGGKSRRSTGDIPKAKRSVVFSDQRRTQSQGRVATAYTSALAAARRVENLCSAIKQTASTSLCSGSCMGILVDEPNGWLHRIFPPRTASLTCFLPNTISLEELLLLECLNLRERLELGLQLALALMKLHKTGWWSEGWGKRDIFFHQKPVRRKATVGGGVVEVGDPIIDEPLVRRTFQSSPPTTPQSAPTPPVVQYDRSLFSLGIVLIELWFQRRIEDLRSPHQLDNDDENADYETARIRIGELMATAGENYGLAVSRSIGGLNSPVGMLRPVARSLEDNIFKSEVHENVICLLEKNLKVFTGAAR
ncbi:hypothetical protein K440DRAFT_663936 [Wilcoxina mikolae CBS 423.85]|nr:hypothetical protein K440DRAFT_663936 [Wilcoxina mikolae CBS 423.85]